MPVAIGGARRAVVDAAGLGHRPAGVAGDHGGVVGAVDGDGDQLRVPSTVVDRERVGQGVADIERLHGGLLLLSV